MLPDGEFARESYFQDSTTRAFFGHAETAIGDQFKLVTGLRYSLEEKSGGVENLFWYDSAIVRAVLAAGGIPDDGTPRNGLDLIGTVYEKMLLAMTSLDIPRHSDIFHSSHQCEGVC